MSFFRHGGKVNTPSAPAAGKGEWFYPNAGQLAGAGTTPSAPAFIDESGNVCRVGGLGTKDFRLIRVTEVAASGTYTPTAGAQALLVECWGGGGAGGGGVTGTTSTSAGTGGGGGAYSAVWVTGASIKTSYTVAVGAGGTVGTAGNNPGNLGGDTTFDSPSICTAKGGAGGPAGGAAAITALLLAGGAGGVATSGVGDIKANGEAGGISNRQSATIAASGRGGNGAFIGGGGGQELVGQGTGNAGLGIAAGGGGGIALNGGASVTGGAGAPGLIRIWEFA